MDGWHRFVSFSFFHTCIPICRCRWFIVTTRDESSSRSETSSRLNLSQYLCFTWFSQTITTVLMMPSVSITSLLGAQSSRNFQPLSPVLFHKRRFLAVLHYSWENNIGTHRTALAVDAHPYLLSQHVVSDLLFDVWSSQLSRALHSCHSQQSSAAVPNVSHTQPHTRTDPRLSCQRCRISVCAHSSVSS